MQTAVNFLAFGFVTGSRGWDCKLVRLQSCWIVACCFVLYRIVMLRCVGLLRGWGVASGGWEGGSGGREGCSVVLGI